MTLETKILPYVVHEDVYIPNPIPIYKKRFLFDLLAERTPFESISHKGMPTLEEHENFIDRIPYRLWHIIKNADGVMIGSVYVSYYMNEIGIAIAKQYRRENYASSVIRNIINTYCPGEVLHANINPLNTKSIDLFSKFKFKHIQNTYRMEPK